MHVDPQCFHRVAYFELMGQVGDVGTKLGELCIDIGYLRMKRVHIPLECMMAKRQHVTEVFVLCQ